jgi:hypothetical protein
MKPLSKKSYMKNTLLKLFLKFLMISNSKFNKKNI